VIGLVLWLSALAWGQSSTRVSPDCTVAFTGLTAGGNSAVLNNLPQQNVGAPCTTWVLAYTASSGTPTISVSIQGAPNANGSPGSFSTITGGTGTTSPSSSVLLKNSAGDGYYPFMRVHVTTLSAGTLSGTLNGWRDDAGSVNGGGGGGGSGCPGTTGTPCVIAGWNGSTAQIPLVSFTEAQVTISAGTDVKLVAGSSGKNTYVNKFDLAWDNLADLSIRTGTTSSTPCDTSTTTIAGPYKNLIGIFEDYASDFSYLVTGSTGLDICLHFSTSVTGGGQVFSNQF